MSGISAIMNIANGALQANQIAMQVVSHNIANANTPGYTRQSAILESQSPVSMSRLKLGMGVQVDSVAQAFDRYTTKNIHQNTSALNEYQSKASVLSQLESLLNETGDSTLSQAMDEFWNAWQDVANNPGDIAERTALLEKGRILARKFNSLSSDLDQVQQNLNINLKTGVKEVNDLTQQIADLNEKIVAAEASKITVNDLRDQRNNLLEKLSGLLGNDYVEQDNGSVIVMTKEGILLVDGNQHWELSTEGNSIYWNGIPNDISKKLTGGKIGGWLDVRDETVPQYKANLDELAGSLIHQVNTLHVNGYALAGATGKYFFENLQTAPAVPNSGDYHDAAAYITLSSDVLDHPENIAAGGQSGAPGDNENARNIAALQTDSTIQLRKWAIAERGANTSSSLQTETMDNYYQDLVGEIGILKEESSQNQDFSQSMLDQLGQIRDSVSGVNLDEELTQMMKIQRAYEAASKMITVADDMLQSLLQLR